MIEISPAVLSLLVILVPVLTVALNAWINRRQMAATTAKLTSDTRHSDQDAAWADVEKRLSFVERSHDALVGSLTQRIEALTVQVRDLNLEIVGLKNLVSTEQETHAAQVAGLNEDIVGLKATIKEQSETITGLNQTVQRQNDTIGGLNDTVAGLGTQIGDMLKSRTAESK